MNESALRSLKSVLFLEFSQLQSTTAICPTLFNATTTENGILSRIRFPAGLITSDQCELLTTVVSQLGNDEIQITNRANLQIRTSQVLTEEIMLDFQDYGLASSTESTDGLRNIMASPIAGIDPRAKVNTIPLVKAWNLYLSQHPELWILSNKFSVSFDGGESISVSDRPNDICFVAVELDHEIYFSLHLGLGDRGDAPAAVGVLIPQAQVIQVLSAITEVYRDYTQQRLDRYLSQGLERNLRSRPPRLRELLHDWGIDRYLGLVEEKVGDLFEGIEEIPPSPPCEGGRINRDFAYIGVHPQKQFGLVYVGVVIPLGRLTSWQVRGLANLAKQYGGGALRLTPWQNILITDIQETLIEVVTREIADLGLSIAANHPYAAIAACSGIKGCKSAQTDTQTDAKAIATHLEKCIQLDYPINMHFTGCDKSCAQHHSSDITFLGIESNPDNYKGTYKVYIGDGDDEMNFGRELYPEYLAKDLPRLMERLLNIYHNQRQNPDQSFREFVIQSHLKELQQKLDHA
jgi:ferredoxin-nitrite reductase